ncbi:MAG: calcium/sodium antiporter [Syntrophaceae bacterium]|nr:calcium/sodium antiporter [Syntrophaceae bacterium]
MYSIFLIIGFVLLIKSADFLVSGASALAKRLGVSDLVIGLTVVAFGTSMPELFVNIFASAGGNTEIAIGNVVGSNIFNILVILGIASIIYPLSVSKGTVWKEIPFSLLAVLVLGALANDMLFDKAGYSMLTRIDGFIFLAFFMIFMYYTAGISKDSEVSQSGKENGNNFLKSLLMVVGGIVGLGFGGKLVVDSAVSIASRFGVSQSLIGLTIVAAGTSLPELATSAVAAYRKNADIAVGNIVGSNIFNIFFILGISSLIKPLPIASGVNIDIFVLIGASLILFFSMFTGKRRIIDRWEGVLFIIFYIAYIGYLIKRG